MIIIYQNEYVYQLRTYHQGCLKVKHLILHIINLIKRREKQRKRGMNFVFNNSRGSILLYIYI